MTRLQASLLTAFMITACDQGSAPSAKSEKGAETAQKAKPDAAAASAAKPSQKLGQVGASEVIDLNGIVNKTPEQVEVLLGAPSDTGTDRISCVRFTPDRVFFACKQEIRIYEHASFERIRIEYEDGRAGRVALVGVPGEGDFEPKAALASVGIILPGEPHYSTEGVANKDNTDGGDAQIWHWGNSSARLIVDGLQHRVRVSIVNGEWPKSKIELLNNHPLDADQQARVKPVRGAADAEPTSEPEVSVGAPAH